MNFLRDHFFYFGIAVILSGFFHLGVILKKEDPIAKTQTDPILYSKKMEELKDGEKGPSMPSMTLYSKSQFLTASPVQDTAKKSSKKEAGPSLEYGEELPGDLHNYNEEEFDESWWTEDTEQNSLKKSPHSDDAKK